MSKILNFTRAGTQYACSLEPGTLGHITQYGEHRFSLPHPEWQVVGFTKRWNQKHITRIHCNISPSDVEGMWVFDRDHGTLRQWGGGGDHKARNAHIVEVQL